MLPKTLSEFFNGAIHLIFGVVAAQGFLVASSIFLPIGNLFQYNGFASAIGLIYAYFFLITSWMGYFRSVSQYPHQPNILGLLRFSAGILVSFLVYYMITLTDIAKRQNYGDMFWIIAVLFGILTIAHFIKFKEYEGELKGDDKKSLTIIIYLTIFFFGVFIIHGIIYHFVSTAHTIKLELNGINVWDTVFTVSAIFLTVFYRLKTWRLYGPTKRMRRSDKNGKKYKQNNSKKPKPTTD